MAGVEVTSGQPKRAKCGLLSKGYPTEIFNHEALPSGELSGTVGQ